VAFWATRSQLLVSFFSQNLAAGPMPLQMFGSFFSSFREGYVHSKGFLGYTPLHGLHGFGMDNVGPICYLAARGNYPYENHT
jgi:hypothetical protein